MMKKFALFAMLICAGLLTFGCAEKKAADKKADKPAATTPDTGGEKAPETPAEPAK
jgi:ABC-type glycerol-3-phosphate transport system substrate-binding protein